MQSFKVDGLSVLQAEWKQMDGRTEAIALPFHANVVGNRLLRVTMLLVDFVRH